MNLAFYFLFALFVSSNADMQLQSTDALEFGSEVSVYFFEYPDNEKVTVINIVYDKATCMVQPIVFKGHLSQVRAKWTNSKEIEVFAPIDSNYDDFTDSGLIYCKDNKIRVVINEGV